MSQCKIIILMLACVFFLPSCSVESDEPIRPPSVPERAMWIGGIDGGAWVLLERKPEHPDYIYYAEIYGDQAGEPWYIGRLEVVPNSGTAVPLNQPEAFGVWDGDKLLLADGRTMRAIDSFDPFASK